MTMKKLTREGATFVIEYDSLVNRTVRRIKPSGIRKFFDIANEMDDVISLSVGEPDFHTPWHIREAGIESLEKGRTSYTPNRGFLKLRAEISNFIERHYHVKYDPQDEVLVTVGGSEAIDLCVRTLVEPGDEVLIPEPSFVCYVPITEMAGGVPVIIETKPENGFRLTAQELEDMYPQLTPKEREGIITKKHKTVFIQQIGGKLKSGKPHDGRAPDYDDWNLNCDIFFWDETLNRALEVSSMGIRVDAESLDRQLTLAHCDDRRTLPFHKMLLNNELPLTIGGGIGQSRLSMLMMGCAHIGEVQSSVWDSETVDACAKAGIPLL